MFQLVILSFFHSETLPTPRTLLVSAQELEKISCLLRKHTVVRGRTTYVKVLQFKYCVITETAGSCKFLF